MSFTILLAVTLDGPLPTSDEMLTAARETEAITRSLLRHARLGVPQHGVNHVRCIGIHRHRLPITPPTGDAIFIIGPPESD